MLIATTPAIACNACQLIVAPNNSTIKITAANSTINANGSTAITAAVTDKSGNNVVDGTMIYFQTSLGTLQPTQARTKRGQAVTQLVAGAQSGTAAVLATSGNNSSDPITVTIGGALSLTVTAQPTTAAINTAVTFTATLSASSGSATADHYDWDFGDGKTATTTTGTNTHVYLTPGTMTVKVTATATDKSTATAQVQVVITLT